jgi:hypothetical protein
MKTRFSGVIIVSCLLAVPLQAAALPVITRYGLNIRFLLGEQQIDAVTSLSIRNVSASPCDSIPFLLYRLLSVRRITDHEGRPLAFTQTVSQLGDQPSFQVREVVLHLSPPLQPGDSASITMTYSGFVFGYPEVMAYVNDRVDETYSLLRPDAVSYPVIARATFADLMAAYENRFSYQISATVPKGYTAACGGRASGRRDSAGTTTFDFTSQTPTWRIDLAVAQFSTLRNPEVDILVYCLPFDSTGARHILEASARAVNLYMRMFGRPAHYQGYTIIEIPEGWGSQAGDFYFLQTAAAFKDSSRIGEVYHEIGHSWNAAASADIQRCRYFDEAFASFFEPLAIRAFNGERAFSDHMEKVRENFNRRARQDQQVFDTPIADYGRKELGSLSYTKGAWSLYVLYTLVGAKDFEAIIHSLLTVFHGRTVTFRDFQSLCERVSHRNLTRFFNEWMYGIESSRLMLDHVPVSDIARRY